MAFYRRVALGDHVCEAFTAADTPCGMPAVEQLVFLNPLQAGQGELYVCAKHLAEHAPFGGHTCAECELAAELAEERTALNVAVALLRRLLASFQDGTFDAPDVARAAEEEVLAFIHHCDAATS